MTRHFLSLFVIIPCLGFLLSLFIPKKNENGIAWTVFYAVLINFIVVVLYDIFWIYQGAPIIDERDLLIYSSDNYVFFIDFLF